MPNYINVDYFVVGGGGGGTGGANGGSPGGAGGVRSGTLYNIVQGVIYSVTVGNGGIGTTGGSSSAGGVSTFSTISASGGGAGSLAAVGGAGGSGAGGPGSSNSYAGGAGNTGAYSPVEGYAGGSNNVTSPYPAGGGGGAGAVGVAGTGSQAGRGGTGTFTTLISTTTAISIGIGQYVTATTAVYFAGGGGGGGTTQGSAPGTGGNGGGGNGGIGGAGGIGSNGTNYTGGGGGGGGNTAGLLGGNGGSGVVMLRTITTTTVVNSTAAFSISSGTYTTYIFTASGTINFAILDPLASPLAKYGTTADMLLVAGGGGAGSDMGGGGGAGGLTTSTQYLVPGTYNITVGAGGSGAPAGVGQVRGSNGTDSMIISTADTSSYSVMFQTAQSISTSASAAFVLAGNFTVEGWVYRLATGDASMIVQGASPYFGINVNPGTGINVYLNNATANLVVTDRIPAIYTWNHIALVRSGSIISVYLNGVASATTASNASSLGYNAVFYIGANNVTGGTNQYISNVRVTNGTALYTGTFTPSGTPLTTVTNTVLLACSSSTYTKDYSTSSFSLTANGAVAGSPFTLLWNPFNSYNTVVGGGGGASEYSNNNSPASFGGSGGGVAGYGSTTYGLGIRGQGTAGGQSGGQYYPGGGGGAVLYGTTGTSAGAKGGDGFPSYILGTTYYWSGGGGGAGYSNVAGNGGAGGGGGGAPLSGGSVSGTGGGYGNTQGINAGSNAPAGTLTAVADKPGGSGGINTGGGGGGGSHYSTNNYGGTGGSGIVVIRYPGPQRGSGGTIYSYTSATISYTAHAFFSSDVFTLNPNPFNPQQNGGPGGPYGGGGGGAAGWVGNGGLGGVGFTLSSGYSSIGGGGGGGVSATAALGGGGGVDVFGITTATNYFSPAGSANSPGAGGSLFNLGGQPGTGGNGGLYGGGGAGAAVESVDTNTGNGAGGALLIVYNTSTSTYSYPSIMPLLSNSVNNASTTLLTVSSTTNKLLLTQFDNIVTSYQDLQYETLNIGNLVNYENTANINVIKIPQSVSVLAGNLQVITYITDHEMMLKNSDKSLLATYDTPYNYQSIQEITPDNDPRLITVRVQNFVVGVTGSDAQFVTAITSGGQTWY